MLANVVTNGVKMSLCSMCPCLRLSVNPQVAGSSPARGAKNYENSSLWAAIFLLKPDPVLVSR